MTTLYLVTNSRKTLKMDLPRCEILDKLFDPTTAWGGHTWVTSTADEIFSLFEEAISDLQNEYLREYEAALFQFYSCNWLSRWLQKMRGWEPPVTPTRWEIRDKLVNLCLEWAKGTEQGASEITRGRPDRWSYIEKVRVVARKLQQLPLRPKSESLIRVVST